VQRQPFTFGAFDDRGAALQVLAPTGLSPQTQTLAYSPAGEVEGELVYVELARPGDFDPAAVQGKVALARRGEIRFGEKVANLAAAGASGVVIFNNLPQNFSGNLGGGGQVPAVSLSLEDGEQLLALLGRGPVHVRLKVDASYRESTGDNIIATKPGGPRTVVIGGHYDSVAAGPGANDNGSGTVTMLELARVVANRHYPFSVRFIAFEAEEIGLLGSAHYVRELDQASRAAIIAMINLDMVGVGDRLAFGGDPGLVETAIRHAGEIGIVAQQLRGGAGSASDHASFQAVNIPSLFVYRGEDPNYHTAGDRAEHVKRENLAIAGGIVLDILDELAANQAPLARE
jgi:aminopeptidase YwaD